MAVSYPVRKLPTGRTGKGVLFLRNLNPVFKDKFKKWCRVRGLDMQTVIEILIAELVSGNTELITTIIAKAQTKKIMMS